jgi:hypothetical protein
LRKSISWLLALCVLVIGSVTLCHIFRAKTLGVSSAPSSPGLAYVTWGTATATCNGHPCVLLDGGPGTFISDPIAMGGLVGVSESGTSFFCSVPYGGAQEDYFSINISNDGYLFAHAPAQNYGLIDGGFGDGGVPGWIWFVTNPFPYAEVSLSHLAPMTFDGGYLDAGVFNDGGWVVFPDGGYVNIDDGGATFCDGGNFCDGGAITYDGGPISYGLMYQAFASVALQCLSNSVPH